MNFDSDNLFMFAIDLNWRDTIFSRLVTPRWSTTPDDDFALLFQEIRKSKKESKEICFIQFNAFFFWRRWQSPSQRLQKVKRWSLTFWEFRLRWYQARKFNDSESWDDSNIQVGLVRCMMCLLGSATVYSIFFKMKVGGYSMKAN